MKVNHQAAPISPASSDFRHEVEQLLQRFEHILPSQAPLKDFVHHNTLHGFQHLEFPRALAEARKLNGAYGYFSADAFRALYRRGRISRAGLSAVLDQDPALQAPSIVYASDARQIHRRAIYLAALLHPLPALSPSQLHWQITELDALRRFQAEVDASCRARISAAAKLPEAAAVTDLWNACLESLGLAYEQPHAEELFDLSAAQAEEMLAQLAPDDESDDPQPITQRHLRREALHHLAALSARVGQDLSLRGLLKALTGEDLLEQLRPYLTRHMGNYLDLGVAAWHHKERLEGFYTAWRRSAEKNYTWILEELTEWPQHLASLPADPLDAIAAEFQHLRLARERWLGYLECLALEMPGWSGMFLWRQRHPGYEDCRQPVSMLDYLAVRLIMERLFAQRLCAEQWGLPPDLRQLQDYFRRHPAEFLVRHALFGEHLPEYLASASQRLMSRREAGEQAPEATQWQHLANMIWTWQHTLSASQRGAHSVCGSAWRWFLLAQHLGLPAREVRAMDSDAVAELLACIDRLDEETAGYIWLRAYENHYRDQAFNALLNNHGRGRWAPRRQRPEAQLIFCMDDREEGLRRHLEERNPRLETFGATGFFGIAIDWLGLDKDTLTKLCPATLQPAHEIHEQAYPAAAAIRHQRRHRWRQQLANLLHQETHRDLLGGTAGALAAPLALLALGGKILAPLASATLTTKLRRQFDTSVATALTLNADDDGRAATPEQKRLGFTDHEQADAIADVLRTIGLTCGFSRLVVLMGHGSSSQNNPHRAAYDCGACSGRHGGPNARIFAAMANRPQVRDLLALRGLSIPHDTWFIGAAHDTCDDSINCYDSEQLPASLRPAWQRLRAQLDAAGQGSAHERSRKFFSAPPRPSLRQALRHVRRRQADISQSRPELGHANNALAVIGRRALSQGVFFDRRVFLISYDSTQDPDGAVLEPLLLSVAPVGAGINLEYYFSAVNNEVYGCGSKITHNINGFFGVMEGTVSDLRGGLPQQMIEIHEAMRLQIVIEAPTAIISAIYQRQPTLQQLIGNGWLLLSAKAPQSADIQLFDPRRGWLPWSGQRRQLPLFRCSRDYYCGNQEALAPVLIEQAATTETADAG
jgi:uncharacterized protein YbcC (UPF0753/DUF2309 family)